MSRYGFFCLLSRVFLRVFSRIEVYGLENIPSSGAFILAPNHISFIDPPAAGAFVGREVYYMARKSLFDIPALGRIISWCNAFPVSRDGQENRAMRRALSVLKNGRGLLLFPEGRRSPDGKLHEASPGVGMLSSAARAPVVPVLIQGTDRALPVGARFIRLAKVRVFYLEPVPPPGEKSRAAYKEIAEEAMKRIREKSGEIEKCLPG